MDKFDRLDSIVESHLAALGELKREIGILKQDNLFEENAALRGRNNELLTINEAIAAQNERLALENKRLKNEMFEQCFNEKTKMIAESDESLNAYFASAVSGEENRLSRFENDFKAETDALITRSEKFREEFTTDAYKQIFELRDRIDAELKAIRKRREETERELFLRKSENIERLKAEPLTGEEIVRRGKQNNLEVMLGLKVLNRLGVFLVLVGITAAVQFTYTRVPDVAKGILVYVFGVFVLGLGEFFGRKKPNVFSIGLTSGGVAILYIATALCFFMLNVIGMYTALLLCVLVTASSFVLARRYNSQTVAAFAVIGGYLPLASIADNEALIYFAMLYFIILNGFSLSVAMIKKWHVAQFIGFGMNVIAALTVILRLDVARQTVMAGVIGVAYMFFSFSVYNAIPLLSSYRSRIKLSRADNVMLILNAVFGTAELFGALYLFDFWDSAGILSIVLGICYFALAKLLEVKMPEEKSCRVLFYITGLMFAVLVIPLQFGVAYLSLGWLIEGVLLLCYGILKEQRIFKISGTVISGLCLFAFVMFDFDVLLWGYSGGELFYRYFFITLGSLLVLASMLYKNMNGQTLVTIYKCAAIVNLWLFLMYSVFDKIPLVFDAIDFGRFMGVWIISYYVNAIAIVVSLAYAYFIMRFKPVTDKPVRVIALIIDAITIAALIFINGDVQLYAGKIPLNVTILSTAVLVVVNLLAVAAVYDAAARLALGRRLGVEWVPIIVSAFFVFLLTQNLVVSLDLSLNNLIITAILALTAVGWIIFGFVRRYHYIRLFGLVLSFVVTAKLFVFDLASLTSGMRIVSYFMMGVSFLAISFVYQYFSKRLERVSEGSGDGDA